MHKSHLQLQQENPSAIYLVNDTFTGTLAAGSVHGTLSDSGHLRFVTDTNNKLSIGSGNLAFATGGVGTGDPGLWYDDVIRRSGLLLKAGFTFTSQIFNVGFSGNKSSAPRNGIVIRTALQIRNDGTVLSVGSMSSGTAYESAVLMRESGNFFFVKGGAFTNWSLIFSTEVGTSVFCIPTISSSTGTTAVGIFNYLSVFYPTWLPSPLLSDGFSLPNTTDGLGHYEGKLLYGLGRGGDGVEWGTETGTFAVTGGVLTVASLTSSIAIKVVDSGKADIDASLKLFWVAGTCSLIVRYADSSNYVRASYNGTNVQLVKRIAGVETTLIDAAATYVAGAIIKVRCVGSDFRVFYNELLISTAQTISDAGVATATKVGVRSSSTSNTFDDLVVFPYGSGNEYSQLDSIT